MLTRRWAHVSKHSGKLCCWATARVEFGAFSLPARDVLVSESHCGVGLAQPLVRFTRRTASIQANLVAHPFSKKRTLLNTAACIWQVTCPDARVSPLLSSALRAAIVYWNGPWMSFSRRTSRVCRKNDASWRHVGNADGPQAVHGWQLLPDFLPKRSARQRRLEIGSGSGWALTGLIKGVQNQSQPCRHPLRCTSTEGQGGTRWAHSRTRTREPLDLGRLQACVHGLLDNVGVLEFDSDECPKTSHASGHRERPGHFPNGPIVAPIRLGRP